MMNNNSFHKTDLPCDYSDLLLSYVYGEANNTEVQRFETHLRNCAACEQEVSAFGMIRESISDWRMSDFAHLASPKIEIPYHNEAAISTQTKPLVATEKSWYESFRERFSFGLMPLAAGFAMLLISVGIGYAVLNRGNDKIVSTLVTNKNVPTISETPKKIVDSKTSVPAEPNRENEGTVRKPELNPQIKPIPASTGVKKAPRPKIVEPSVSPVQNQNSVSRPDKISPRNQTKAKTKPSKEVENLSDDEEDESPRLSDLFDEIASTR